MHCRDLEHSFLWYTPPKQRYVCVRVTPRLRGSDRDDKRSRWVKEARRQTTITRKQRDAKSAQLVLHQNSFLPIIVDCWKKTSSYGRWRSVLSNYAIGSTVWVKCICVALNHSLSLRGPASLAPQNIQMETSNVHVWGSFKNIKYFWQINNVTDSE